MRCLPCVFVVSLALAACGSDTSGGPTLGTVGDGSTTGGDSQLGDAGGGDASVGTDGATASDAAGDTASGGDDAIGDGTVGDATSPGDGTVTDGGGTIDASPDIAPAKYPTCSALLQCVQVACGDKAPPGCEQVCLTGASPAAAAGLEPVGECKSQVCEPACQGNPDTGCVGKCMSSVCLGTLVACAADGKTGTSGCDTAPPCFEACKEQGFPCFGGCYAKLSPAAQADLQAYFACAAKAAPQEAEKVCGMQILQCITGEKTGGKACYEVMDCQGGCEGKPEGEAFACMAACFGQATPAAKQQLLAIGPCLQSVPGPACIDAYVGCAAPAGTANCLQTIACTEACKKDGKDDGGCAFGCLHQATPVEAKATIELMVCHGVSCGDCKGDDKCEDECLKTKCKAQFDKCLGG